MKEVAIDIDEKSPKDIYDTLRESNISEGDHLKLIHAAKTAFYVIMVLSFVYLFLKMHKAFRPFGERTLDDLFGKYGSEEDLEAEIEKEYGIKVTVETKHDPDREDWMRSSAIQFGRGYSDADDIYDSIPLEEPNPDYIPWNQGKS